MYKRHKRRQNGVHMYHCNSGFLPLFISVQFRNCNILFFYTQDTAMHNSKFKKSIASTTIKNSLSKTSFPRHSPFSKMGKGLLRYARWISSFTKLDNNKSNNNNDNNNFKSNIFCLCSILLIHINRGIFTPRVQVYTFKR